MDDNSKIAMWLVLGILTLATMLFFAPESQPKTAEQSYLDCMKNQWTDHIQNGQSICQSIIDNLKPRINQ